MANLEAIQKLIEKIPEIEKCFYSADIGGFSSYDWKTNQKRTSTMRSEMIYKSPEFMAWRDELVCELSKLKQDKFVDEIIYLSQHFSGLGDRNKFDKLSAKLRVMKDHLGEYEPDYDLLIKDDRIPETELSDKVLRALSKMQRNHHYDSSSSEDTMNDYIRDILDESYNVKDQTRQGDSTRGDEAGEVDIQLCDSGFPLVMIEGVKLDSLVKETLNTHIDKVLVNYDPNGCPYAFILIYTTVVRFDEFYRKLLNYLTKYKYPYERQTDIQDMETGYTELRHAQTILLRSEKNVRLHFYVAHI
jgi:hypothetical protein